MPGGDRTGSMGMGAMSGRAAGFCSGSAMPGFASVFPRRGFGTGPFWGRVAGMGFGGGRLGRRNMFYATGIPGRMRRGDYAPSYGYPAAYQQSDPEVERNILREQAEGLQAELEIIKKRLSELETKRDGD